MSGPVPQVVKVPARRATTDAEVAELRCTARTLYIRYTGKPGKVPRQCGSIGVYVFDGRRLCTTHAQAAALHWLIGAQA